eukprot:scaffold5992_cov78-Skeletonema_marinoi.AAC.2
MPTFAAYDGSSPRKQSDQKIVLRLLIILSSECLLSSMSCPENRSSCRPLVARKVLTKDRKNGNPKHPLGYLGRTHHNIICIGSAEVIHSAWTTNYVLGS